MEEDPYAELKAAYKAGKVIEIIDCDYGLWREIPDPMWTSPAHRYRVRRERSRKKIKPKVRWQVVIDCKSRDDARRQLRRTHQQVRMSAFIKDNGK